MGTNSHKLHSFYESKYIGDTGEAQFLKNYPQFMALNTKTVTDVDFVGKLFGIKAELKTDTYNSPNFFIERWSNAEQQKEGGPWQSFAKGANWYVYWFVKDPTKYYWLRLTKQNLEALTELYRNAQRTESHIRNRNYTTVGKALAIQEVLKTMPTSFVETIGQAPFKFFSGYVGSKRAWIDKLRELKGLNFVELFAGSAALSANLAGTAVFNDSDEYVTKILANFDQQKVTNAFDEDEYKKVRMQNDWWKYAFCLQKMAFSGVFRYSKNGYNVPAKPKGTVKMDKIEEEYAYSLTRWKELNPKVVNGSYLDVPLELIENAVVILDPPYAGSKAAYNTKPFDYGKYWEFVEEVKTKVLVLIVFDRKENLQRRGLPVFMERKMRVNGARQGDIEAMSIFCCGNWLGNGIIEVYGSETEKGVLSET